MEKAGRPARHLGASGHGRVLDDTDRRMIGVLVREGRISVSALAEQIHISRTHAHARLRLLQDLGVIEGFAAQIASEAAGLHSSAYVALSIRQNSWRGVAAALRMMPFVYHYSLLGGDFDVLAQVRAPNNAALRDLVLTQLQAVDGVLATKTWLIFDEAVGPGAPWL